MLNLEDVSVAGFLQGRSRLFVCAFYFLQLVDDLLHLIHVQGAERDPLLVCHEACWLRDVHNGRMPTAGIFRMMKRIALLLLIVAAWLLTPTVHASDHCQFVLGFKETRDSYYHEYYGECLENERPTSYGATQRTTKGVFHRYRDRGYITFIPNAAPTPEPTVVPTPTPIPEPYIDPRLESAIRVMRTTEIGELMWQYFLHSGADATFADLPERRHGEYSSTNHEVRVASRARHDLPFVAAILVHEIAHAWISAHAEEKYLGVEGCFEEEELAFKLEMRWWLEYYGRGGKDGSHSQDQLLTHYLNSTPGDWVHSNEDYQEQCAA